MLLRQYLLLILERNSKGILHLQKIRFMNILGLNFYYHDSTACIVSDGHLVVAIEEERLTRKKHATEFPIHAIDKCLQVAGLTPANIDYIAISVDPTLSLGKKMLYGLRHLRRSRKFIWEEMMMNLFWKRRRFSNWYRPFFGEGHKPPVHYVPHHLSHVVGTFFNFTLRKRCVAVCRRFR